MSNACGLYFKTKKLAESQPVTKWNNESPIALGLEEIIVGDT
jgi:hypothetical protein